MNWERLDNKGTFWKCTYKSRTAHVHAHGVWRLSGEFGPARDSGTLDRAILDAETALREASLGK